MDILQAHAVRNLCYTAAEKMVPQGIVVHSTGCSNPNLRRYVDCPEEVGSNRYGNHWNTPKPDGRKVCVHAFIGLDKDKVIRVAEILPLDICCWGAGKGKKGSYNDAPPYLQFEICEDNCRNADYYRQVFQSAAEYCAHLCRRFGLSVRQIVSHREAHAQGYASNHGDPEHWMQNFGENMDDFRRRVADLLAETPPAIHAGDLVAIAADACYYTGKEIPAWVKKQRWYVKTEPKNDRVVIHQNEAGTHFINSPISARYLTVIA